MSVTPEDLSSELGLDITAGRRPSRRSQASPTTHRLWTTPFRRIGALSRVVLESATRPRARVLTLDLPEYTVSFHGPAEFEFALYSRTEFPVRKLAVLMRRSADDLQVMASNIRQVEKRFAEALARSLHQPGLISDLLRQIELKLFSRDHQWRDIAEALNHLSPAYDVYKRIALVKYIQYLGCRQDMLRNLYLDKLRTEHMRVLAEEPAAPVGQRAPVTLASAAVASQCSAGPEHDALSLLTPDTAIFQLEQIHREDDTEGFASLPRGETVNVEVQPGESVELRLSTCRLKLHPGQRFRITDQSGDIHLLTEGKSIVGRHNSADIVVAADDRTISRRHLMIEPVSPTRVKLTDLSSHGTSLPIQFLNQVQ